MKKICFLLIFFPFLSYASSAPSPLFGKIINFFLDSSDSTSGPSWCITCPMFQAVYRSIATTTKLAFEIFTPSAKTLLALGVLYGIVFRMLKYFTIFQEVGFMEVFGDILKFLGRALIAYILLTNLGSIFTYFINPILNLSLTLANKIQSDTGLLAAVQEIDLNGTHLSCNEISCSNIVINGSLFSEKVCQGLTKLICTLTASTLVSGIMSMYLVVIGATEFQQGWVANIYTCFTGLLLTAGFFQLLLRLPVLFLDSIFRLGFVFILSPFYVVFWVFPSTLEYLKNAFEIIFYTCIFFVCSSAFVYIALHITSFLFRGDTNTSYTDIFDTLASGTDLKTVKEKFNLESSYLLSSIALCFLATKILDMAHVLTSQLVKAKGRIPELQLGSALGQGTSNIGKIITRSAQTPT